jgi:hypothetical protein
VKGNSFHGEAGSYATRRYDDGARVRRRCLLACLLSKRGRRGGWRDTLQQPGCHRSSRNQLIFTFTVTTVCIAVFDSWLDLACFEKNRSSFLTAITLVGIYLHIGAKLRSLLSIMYFFSMVRHHTSVSELFKLEGSFSVTMMRMDDITCSKTTTIGPC